MVRRQPGSIPEHSRHVIFVLKPGSQHWGLCITHESVNHFLIYRFRLNFGCKRTTEDDKRPVLAVTSHTASIERSSWCKCSEKC